jgi:hypothetical protein
LPPADTPEGRSLRNLQALAQAMLQFHEQQKLLPGAARCNAQGTPLLSWRVLLLPYLGQEALYKEFHLDESWDSPHNQALLARIPEVYKTPGGPTDDKTCYLAPLGVRTIFAQREGMALSAIRDGPKNTLLIVEADPEKAVPWTQPEDLRIIPAQPSLGLGKLRDSQFLGVCADGVPHIFSATSDAAALRALFSANGGEKVTASAIPGKQAEAAAPKLDPAVGLLRQARRSMAQGHGKQAMAFLTASAIVRPSEEVLGQMRWSPGLKRPMLATRWGLALSTGARSSKQEAAPNNPAPGVEMGGGTGGTWQTLVGLPLAAQLNERISGGAFGKWLTAEFKNVADEEEKKEPPPAGAEPGPGGIVPPPAQPEAMPPGGAPPGAEGAMPGNAAVNALSERLGVTLLGTADAVHARQMALREGLDVLLVAECTTKAGRGRAPSQSILVLQVFDVFGGKVLWGSRPLSDIRVQAAQQGKDKEKKSDPAAELLQDFMKFVDERLTLTDMPPIGAEAAKNRAETLVQRQTEYPLPLLLELRYYQWKNLLTPEQLSACYAKLIGPDDGPGLATGTDPQRYLIVQRWLPKQ